MDSSVFIFGSPCQTQIWKTIFKHVKPEAPRRYKYNTFVKNVFFKPKWVFPSNAS